MDCWTIFMVGVTFAILDARYGKGILTALISAAFVCVHLYFAAVALYWRLDRRPYRRRDER